LALFKKMAILSIGATKMVSKLLGFSAPPKVATPEPAALAEDSKKAVKSRRNQFITEGQASGMELTPQQVSGATGRTFGN
jgi:hypothetical protein